jgi:ABC-2 type transport system ATP-binding protein
LNAPAIETSGLTRHYGPVRALEDLSLRVEEGEVFGFLGPNGAGKTTTIRLLLGLIRPHGGTFRTAPRAETGYLPGELALWPDLSGAVTLNILARLSGRAPVARNRLLEQLVLTPAELRRPVRTYSDGMKQKLGIIQALQCAPRLALLDEPTKGLDPLMQQEFYAVIAAAREGGTTVFFSSHVLPEVERVCDRVAMLRQGRLVSMGGVDELRRAQRRRVTVTFTADQDPELLAPFGAVEAAEPRRVVLLVPQAELPALIGRLGLLPLADVAIEEPGLEDAFLELYR